MRDNALTFKGKHLSGAYQSAYEGISEDYCTRKVINASVSNFHAKYCEPIRELLYPQQLIPIGRVSNFPIAEKY